MAKEMFSRVKPHLGANEKTVTVEGETAGDLGLAKDLALPDLPQTETTGAEGWTLVYSFADTVTATAYIDALGEAGADVT